MGHVQDAVGPAPETNEPAGNDNGCPNLHGAREYDPAGGVTDVEYPGDGGSHNGEGDVGPSEQHRRSA